MIIVYNHNIKKNNGMMCTIQLMMGRTQLLAWMDDCMATAKSTYEWHSSIKYFTISEKNIDKLINNTNAKCTTLTNDDGDETDAVLNNIKFMYICFCI